MRALSQWSAGLVMALALGSGACDVAPAANEEPSSMASTADDLEQIEMISSALTNDNGANGAKGVWSEDFEAYPAGSTVGNYNWWSFGNSSMTVSNQDKHSGKQSWKLSVAKDAANKVNRAASVMCAPWGTRKKLTAQFHILFSSFGSWNMIGITDNPRMAAWWWVGPEGGLREGNFSMASPKPAMTMLKTNTWYEVKLEIDLEKDQAKMHFGSFSKSVSLSSTWGTIGVPIECLRITTGLNVDQNVFVDKVSIKDSVD